MVASKIRQHLRNLWFDDRGQSTTEYILILAVVVMIALKFKQQFNVTMGKALTSLNDNLSNAMDTSGSGGP